jgi:hypothetical protein
VNPLRLKLFFGAIFVFSGSLFSQVKFEREYRIRKDTIAENACIFINQSGILKEKTRVKWYREESQEGTSLEAKFKQNGARYSIEFTEDGLLEDVEIEIEVEDLPTKTLEEMQKTLDREFKTWKIKKIQRQWIGSEVELIESIKSNKSANEVMENFEIVIKGNNGEEKGYFELLFDREGELLEKKRIVDSPGDILIY